MMNKLSLRPRLAALLTTGIVCLCLLGLGSAPSAWALSGKIREFAVPTANSEPGDITAGPDGNLWFTERADRIGRINPSTGAITEFPLPKICGSSAGCIPVGIVAGPDDNLWFTEINGNNIGRISTIGVITEYPLLTANSVPEGITAGPDGNLWFAEYNGNNIGRISPTSKHKLDEFAVPTANSGPVGIIAGSDGNM